MFPNIYNQKVTILNKLKRTDGKSGKDEWYKYVIDDVAWYTDSARSAGNHDVFIGTYITVLIPFHDDYMPYLKWKNLDSKSSHFTISAGDYIVLGDVTEEINASNVVKVMESYGDTVCLVRHRNENYNRYGATVQLKIEGV